MELMVITMLIISLEESYNTPEKLNLAYSVLVNQY